MKGVCGRFKEKEFLVGPLFVEFYAVDVLFWAFV